MRKIKVDEIARISGVSPTTVMNVIYGRKEKMREETYERVVRVIHETGYVKKVAPRLLAGKEGNLLGLVINENALDKTEMGNLINAVFALEKECRKKNYYVILYVCEKAEEVIVFAKTWNLGEIFTWGINKETAGQILDRSAIQINTLDF